MNGDFDKEYDINFFKNYNFIVCIDGGYEKFLKLKLNKQPDYLIGDFDSISNMSDKTKNLPKDKIIFKDNQDETDTEFALKFILKKYNEKISRWILKKKGPGVNGIYNQDFSPETILIEVGGEKNTIDEVNNTLKIVAEVIRDYLRDEKLWKRRKIIFLE